MDKYLAQSVQMLVDKHFVQVTVTNIPEITAEDLKGEIFQGEYGDPKNGLYYPKEYELLAIDGPLTVVFHTFERTGHGFFRVGGNHTDGRDFVGYVNLRGTNYGKLIFLS